MPRKSPEKFIEEAITVHGNIYDYSETKYKTGKDKVVIICKIHGPFEQIAFTHLRGSGCRDCHFDKKRKTTERFIADAIKVHGDKYDYSKVEYYNAYKEVTIIAKLTESLTKYHIHT